MHKEILEKQKDIIFDPVPHTYHYKGKLMTSGTTFLKPYSKPFEKEKILKKLYKDVEERINKRYEWDNSSTHGTRIHELLEAHFNGETIKSTEHQFLSGKKLVNRFINEEDLELVGNEVIVTDKKRICGTIDVLMFNPKTNKYVLLDYKTCDNIPMNGYNGEKLKEPLQHIEDCKFTKYSLQLSLYATILEETYGVEVEECWLLWIPKNGKGTEMRCNNYKKEMRALVYGYTEELEEARKEHKNLKDSINDEELMKELGLDQFEELK